MDKKAQEYFAKMRNVIRWGDEHGKTPPFSAGAMLAYNHFMDSLQDESSMVECTSFPESADVEDYIMTMSKAGLVSIIINASDEGLTGFLVAAAAVGCEVGRRVNFEKVNATGNEPIFAVIELKLPVHTASEQEIADGNQAQ